MLLTKGDKQKKQHNGYVKYIKRTPNQSPKVTVQMKKKNISF